MSVEQEVIPHLHLHPLLVLVHVKIQNGKEISIVMMETTIVAVNGMEEIVVEVMLTQITA